MHQSDGADVLTIGATDGRFPMHGAPPFDKPHGRRRRVRAGKPGRDAPAEAVGETAGGQTVHDPSVVETALKAVEKGGVPLITRDRVYLKLGSLTTG